MKIFNLKTTGGIGDCIIVRSQLLPLINSGVAISISTDRPIMEKYRPENTVPYIEFVYNFMKLLFPEKNCNVTKDQSYPFLTSLHLCYNFGYLPKILNLQSFLCPYERNISEQYITIGTKVRDLYRNKFNIYYKNIFDQINKSNYKVVILGEKNLSNNIEYKIHGPNKTYSIYNEIISSINKNKIIDMTLSKIELPNIEAIKKDCSIMKYAEKNIVFGYGGNLALAMSSGNTECYIPQDCGRFNTYVAEFKKSPTIKFISL
jgi:hypothetical protein